MVLLFFVLLRMPLALIINVWWKKKKSPLFSDVFVSGAEMHALAGSEEAGVGSSWPADAGVSRERTREQSNTAPENNLQNPQRSWVEWP